MPFLAAQLLHVSCSLDGTSAPLYSFHVSLVTHKKQGDNTQLADFISQRSRERSRGSSGGRQVTINLKESCQ